MAPRLPSSSNGTAPALRGDAALDAALTPLVGVLAGGSGTRMGGCDKALLRTREGETLLARLQRVTREAGLAPVVVGGGARAGVDLALADSPLGIGPLGGLHALLLHAGSRPVIALACDLPYVSAALLARLAHASCAAPVLAPRDRESGKWQALCARYDSARVLASLEHALARGERSFQGWLREVRVEPFALEPGEDLQLRDWDEPGDIAAG
jgi:molybdopterin-guanine dinucleotide biosynthesis protein A